MHDGLFYYSVKTASLGKVCFSSYSLKHSRPVRLQELSGIKMLQPLTEFQLFCLIFCLFQSFNYTSIFNFICKTLLALKGNKVFIWLNNETTGPLKRSLLFIYVIGLVQYACIFYHFLVRLWTSIQHRTLKH